MKAVVASPPSRLLTIAGRVGAGPRFPPTRRESVLRQAESVAPALEVERQIEPVEFFRYSRRSILRIWQDYVLRPDDAVRQVVVIFGTATIEGRVDGDVVVVLGQARLASTAVVHGSVVVVAGDVTLAQGAVIRQDLVVVGGRPTRRPTSRRAASTSSSARGSAIRCAPSCRGSRTGCSGAG